ncbi:DnaJ-domain-containing protein [Penicillium angulare]|uniref:DnaJ-domain-containing protein n=1 Tax=Penicillium angulare TaxID=116970 RepID=UPI002540F9ED|nr:DnaJ-domain-containing protein [Penicillium angulare]KAJ5281500.1 DnaJ-domain-containing protein [Penicillium angulare]
MRHHPDRNRKDPKAHHKFTRISTAYNTLRNAQKRAAYDRDHGLNRTQQPSYPSGSHSSHSAGNGSFAGSRPASGLSKRRGTFQGPPPSFYEQGGYGRTGRTGREGGYSYSGEEFGGKSTGKAEDPGRSDGIHISHFNAQAHFKTQSAEDRRRIERRRAARRAAVRDEEAIARSGGHIDMGMLVSVLGILVGACCIGGLVTRLPRDSMPSGGAAGALDAAEAKRKKENGVAAS